MKGVYTQIYCVSGIVNATQMYCGSVVKHYNLYINQMVVKNNFGIEITFLDVHRMP